MDFVKQDEKLNIVLVPKENDIKYYDQINSGTIYIVKETSNLYYDWKDKRSIINDIIIVDNDGHFDESSIYSQNPIDGSYAWNKFYYDSINNNLIFVDSQGYRILVNQFSTRREYKYNINGVEDQISFLGIVDKLNSLDNKINTLNSNLISLSADNIPCTTPGEMVSTSIGSAINELYERVTDLEEVILFEKDLVIPTGSSPTFVEANPEVFAEDIELSDNADNYIALEFCAITDDKYKVHARIDYPNGYGLNLQQTLLGWGSVIMKCKTYNINGNHLTLTRRADNKCYAGSLIISGLGTANDGVNVNVLTDGGMTLKRDPSLFGIYKVVGYRYNQDSIRGMISRMSLEEKVGQMFIVRPEQLCSNLNNAQQHGTYGLKAVDSNLITGFNTYKPGGIILFQKNLETESQVKQLIRDYKNLSNNYLPFVCVDEEGGRVARVANSGILDVEMFGDAATIPNAAEAYREGGVIGTYLYDLGFNTNFAPVADVNSNPANPIIGTRSFSSDPDVVASMVGSYIDGLHTHNIMSAIKHFPGHGDTDTDTHTGFASVTKTWQDMLNCEIIPFAYNSNKTDFVMVAHITPVNVDPDNLPASLSYEVITNKLRGELGYQGLVITDGMEMGAITNNYTSAEAAVMAVQAGVDIILAPYDLDAAYNAIITAVRNNEIPESRIDESVSRILAKKKANSELPEPTQIF